MLRKYYYLTKPGIIRGNLLTAAAGFFLGAQGDVNAWKLLAALAGISLVIASACVFNNYIDREIDSKMARTKNRAIPSGQITAKQAMPYGIVLGLIGFFILAVFINLLTVALGIAAMVAYVVVYGIAKRHSVYGTLVGSISGALPPVAGYTAATGKLDTAALLLFVILVFWQMPHFYAISIFRMKEYKAAKIPVWPIVKGLKSTKRQIFSYMMLFIIASLSLSAYGYAGPAYAATMLAIGLYWLFIAVKNLNIDSTKWAIKVFTSSLYVLPTFCASILIDSVML